MRAWLPFLRVNLAAPVLPALLSRDAAGAGDEAGSTGAFVVGLGFSSWADLERVWAGRSVRGAMVGVRDVEPTSLASLNLSRQNPLDAVRLLYDLQAEDDPEEWIPLTTVRASVTTQSPWFRCLQGR